MNIVQTSNLFNMISLAHPDINYYHAGWLSDINQSIRNNHTDATGLGEGLGKQYPAVLFAMPAEGLLPNVVTRKNEINILLIFEDLLGYDNNGDYVSHTSLEVWAKLQRIVRQFIDAIIKEGKKAVSRQDAFAIKDNLVNWSMDSHTYNDRSCFIEVRFVLCFNDDCVDIDLDINAIPDYVYPMPTYDLEDTRNQDDGQS